MRIASTSHSSCEPGVLCLGLGMLFLLSGVMLGCHRETPAPPPAPPRVARVSDGTVDVLLRAEPPAIDLTRDVLLTLTVTAPTNIVVVPPAPADRLVGFTLGGAFEREPQTRTGRVTRTHCILLTPTPAEMHRLRPMAVRYHVASDPTYAERWVMTPPLAFDMAPLLAGKPPTTWRAPAPPVRVYPTFQTVAGWLVACAALIGLAAAAWHYGRRLRRQIRLRRLSPKERALHELNELAGRNLIAQDRIKEYYLELTLIVRRYIERAHAVRAPELTTEEFLLAAARDARFSRAVVRKLQDFLQTADLVKFAGFRPDPATTQRMVATARDYIETDEQERAGLYKNR